VSCYETILWAHSYFHLTTVNVAGFEIPLADQINILGVTLDKNLSIDNHVNAVSKSVHYHIRALLHICPFISEDIGKNGSLCTALLGFRMAQLMPLPLTVSCSSKSRLVFYLSIIGLPG